MKSLVILLVLVGVAVAGRPEAEQVISTFKNVAPLYKAALDADQSKLIAIKSNLTTQLVDFHLSIIGHKESFVGYTISREERLLQQIASQPADPEADVCLGFVRSSSEMTINLAGVSYTNCVNAADETLNTKVSQYYGSLGSLEAKVSHLRLLDVFRGDNVFFSPTNIINKLNNKLATLENNPSFNATEIEALANAVSQDLGTILNSYNSCMTGANSLLDQGLNMCEMQMTVICGANIDTETVPPSH